MTDFIGYVLQGFFVGVGTVTGQWFHESYVKPKLERVKHHASSVLKGSGTEPSQPLSSSKEP